MALGTPTHRGSAGTRNVSGTTQGVSPSATLAVGVEVFVRAAFDNNSTTDGATNDLSIDDSVGGNTWEKVWEYTETAGSANDGTTCALFKSRLATQIGTSDTITVTTDASVTTRLVAVDSVTSDDPLTWETITPGTHTKGSTDDTVEMTLAYSGLTSREYLAWFVGSIERSDGGYTLDGDYTELTKVFTTGGSQATNQTSFCAYRINTMTGDTYNHDVAATAEYVGGLVFFYEEAGGPTAYEIDAQPGSYTVTGVVAGTKQGYMVNAAPGSYAVTGIATPRAYGRFINAAAGSYVLSGAATGHLRGRVLIASPGSYALTGVAAELSSLTHYVIDAQPGAYTLTGAAASLTQGYALNAAPGSYALTGVATPRAYGRFINAESGGYTITGTSAGVLVGRVLVASPGSYALTGVAAELVYEPVSGSYSLNCEPGSYAVTGPDASVVADRFIVAAPGTYTLTGVQAAAVMGYVLNASSGVYAVTGAAMGNLRNYVLSATPGEYNITGVLADLVKLGAAVYVPPAEGDISSITAEGDIELLSAEGTIVVIGPEGEIWLIT